ncbi:nucleoside recognition domain-containing protein [Calderihabitans maritimus]|uniref:Nucleoside recognition domain-containing protein n=2 Tax=Calderihabitans maritimus TaxID=1246530 RepID=A0A1Z5HPE0_9FIRM|nr:nucleoside recognition domain-containing protein [Calderihabitans maritimus]
MRIFQLPSEASLPLLAGLIFGITYGAGVILQAARDGHLSKRDLYLISTFLVIFHSLFEDTMLFVAIGANGFILIFVRLILAVGITFIAARFAFHEQKQSLHR